MQALEVTVETSTERKKFPIIRGYAAPEGYRFLIGDKLTPECNVDMSRQTDREDQERFE